MYATVFVEDSGTEIPYAMIERTFTNREVCSLRKEKEVQEGLTCEDYSRYNNTCE
jgi:hypothetical protein